MAAVLLTLSGLIGMAAIAVLLLIGADSRLQRYQEIAQVTLPYSVWNYDNIAIAEFLDAVTQDPEIAYIKVFQDAMSIDSPKTEFSVDTIDDWLLVNRTFSIHYQNREVAQVLLVQSRHGIWVKILISFVALSLVIFVLLRLIIRKSIRLTEQFIFTPLQRLEASAALMAEGNLEHRLDIGGDDEIGSLARSLDSMRGAIANLFEKLQLANADLSQQNNILEEKVRERTIELEKLNERLSSENLRMGTELEITKRLQEMVLPRDEELRTVEGLDISTHMEPADEVGGDYFDILRSEHGVHIGIGDVTGHGLESGVLMLLTQSAVRTLSASKESDLQNMVNILNRSLIGNIDRMGNGKNLTLALIDYRFEQGKDDRVGSLKVVGQHESILIYRRTGSVEEVETLLLGMPIGLVEDVSEYLGEEQIHLYEGDVVLLYTDGITEAANLEQELFGIERLKMVLSELGECSAQEIKQGIVKRVKQFIGDQQLLDDLTLLVLKQEGEKTGTDQYQTID